MLILVLHLALGACLFWLLNWIGEHAAGFGYMNLSVPFSQDEAPAFNFLLRTLTPVVFIILVSMIFYAAGFDELVKDVWLVSFFSYLLRFSYNLFMSRLQVLNLPLFSAQSALGIALSYIAYQKLILPKTPLFPSAASLAEELWVALAVFVYAIFNNVRFSAVGNFRRRKRYLVYWANRIRESYCQLVDNRLDSKLLELAAYAVLIHENFNRPPFFRWIERRLPLLGSKSFGIMQVSSPVKLSDHESVERGVVLLNQFRAEAIREHPDGAGDEWFIVERAIAMYNRDASYVAAVQELMGTLAHQVLTEYRVLYETAIHEGWRTAK